MLFKIQSEAALHKSPDPPSLEAGISHTLPVELSSRSFAFSSDTRPCRFPYICFSSSIVVGRCCVGGVLFLFVYRSRSLLCCFRVVCLPPSSSVLCCVAVASFFTKSYLVSLRFLLELPACSLITLILHLFHKCMVWVTVWVVLKSPIPSQTDHHF